MNVNGFKQLDFDPATHTYRINGVVVPSVTQIIRAVIPGIQAGEWYMQRGTAIHHGCRLLDEGRLDWSSVSPEIEPRVRAWQQFRRDYRAEVFANEQAVSHPVYRYAGTLDRILREVNSSLVIVDLKSTLEPQVAIQLGGYSLAWSQANSYRKIDRAVGVELRDDGSYRCVWYTPGELRRAEQTFLACLTVYGFMQANQLKGNDERRSDYQPAA